MKLDDEIYTEVCKNMLRSYNGKAVGKRKIKIALKSKNIENMFEDLLLTIDDLKDKITELQTPKEEPIADEARGNYY